MQHPPANSDASIPNAFVCAWLAAALLIGRPLRVHGVDEYHFNSDESLHSTIAQGKTLAEVLKLSRYEAHPPFYYMGLHYWLMLFSGPAAARGYSLLFGLALIPLYYRIGSYMNGKLAGLIAASIVAFSPGCIIQSYMVRHYSVFLFLISCSFYAYLIWRDTRRAKALVSYSAFALLACLTHFSGIFFVFCIAVFEILDAGVQRVAWQHQLRWAMLNSMIGLASCAVYRLWLPRITALALFFKDTDHTHSEYPLLYMRNVPEYLLSRFAWAMLPLCALLLALTALRWVENRRELLLFFFLACGGCVLGIVLAVSDIYPAFYTRHSLWLFPLLAPVTAWIIAEAGRKAAPMMHMSPGYTYMVVALGALLLSIGAYDSKERFAFREFTLTEAGWQAVDRTLQTIGPRAVIVVEKDDAGQLQNVYPFMGRDAFAPPRFMAVLVPYRSTHLLINPYYIRFYTPEIFLKTLGEARDRHMLDGIDTLVFLRFNWSRSPVIDLMLCAALPKETRLFPAPHLSTALTRKQIEDASASMLYVSKTDFFARVAPLNASAHACLKPSSQAASVK